MNGINKMWIFLNDLEQSPSTGKEKLRFRDF